MSAYVVARLHEIGEVTDGRCPWRPVRHHLGITSFGINAWTGHHVGDRIINEHVEEDDYADEELYLVHEGRAVFELDGRRVDAPAGTLVYVPPETKRTAFAEEAGTTVVAIGGVPGQPYEPSGWEIWRPLHHLYEDGAYAEAAERGREVLAAHPEYTVVLYNVACCESLSGQTADAIEHLRLAIDRSERCRSLAAEDSDFDPIRGEPAFEDLVAHPVDPS